MVGCGPVVVEAGAMEHLASMPLEDAGAALEPRQGISSEQEQHVEALTEDDWQQGNKREPRGTICTSQLLYDMQSAAGMHPVSCGCVRDGETDCSLSPGSPANVDGAQLSPNESAATAISARPGEGAERDVGQFGPFVASKRDGLQSFLIHGRRREQNGKWGRGLGWRGEKERRKKQTLVGFMQVHVIWPASSLPLRPCSHLLPAFPTSHSLCSFCKLAPLSLSALPHAGKWIGPL